MNAKLGAQALRQAAGAELLFERHELPEVYISPKTKSGAQALRQAAGAELLFERHELPEVYNSPKTKSGAEALRQAAGADFALSEKLTENALLAVGRQ